MREKYDLEKKLTISLSQARAAVLMDICARCAGFGLAPEEEHVMRELEAAVEAQIDFILDPGYRAILADIRSGLRREIDFGDIRQERPSGPARDP